MQFNEKFNVSHAWQVLNKMIEDNTDNKTFFVNCTRYFLTFNILQSEYQLHAFLPHKTLIMSYSHETKQSVGNNFVGECFLKAFEQTTLTIVQQEPKLTKSEGNRIVHVKLNG